MNIDLSMPLSFAASAFFTYPKSATIRLAILSVCDMIFPEIHPRPPVAPRPYLK
jgi:hypothetical protein